MQRRICHKEQKGKKGASGYALRTLLAGLKSGQFICSKSGQFYLLTTDFFGDFFGGVLGILEIFRPFSFLMFGILYLVS